LAVVRSRGSVAGSVVWGVFWGEPPDAPRPAGLGRSEREGIVGRALIISVTTCRHSGRMPESSATDGNPRLV